MPLLDAGMRELGLVQGQDDALDVRWAGSDASRFAPLAAELLAGNPRAVVVSTNLAAIAVQKLSPTVAIIGTGLNAPVATGLVQALPVPAEISPASPPWQTTFCSNCLNSCASCCPTCARSR